MQLGATLRPADRLTPGGKASRSTDPRPTPAASSAIRWLLQSTWLLPALAGAVAVAWVVAVFGSERAHFVIVSRPLGIALVAAIAITRLTAAAVLLVYPDEEIAPALRWIGLGFLLQAVGSVTITRILPSIVDGLDSSHLSYGLTAVWFVSGVCWLAGLAQLHPPRLGPRLAVSVTALGLAACLAVTAIATNLPRMYHLDDSGTAVVRNAPLENLTPWHWLASSIPFLFPIVAAALTYRRLPSSGIRVCLVVGFALLAGAALHHAVWPGGFDSAATPTNLLRLISLLVVTGGGFMGLRRIAAERAHHLAAARTRANELGIVVAHELGSPIAAIRGLVDILVLPDVDPADRTRALASIRGETAVLSVLAEDIKTLGAVEHQVLPVASIPVDLGLLIGDAVGFARVLPGDHPIAWPQTLTGRVVADPERIAQVFRNLLTNAAKYSSPGTPIDIRVQRHDGRIRVAVVDRGPGVDPADTHRIFEKFCRGRRLHSCIPGTGIGLYIARALVRAHGCELTVEPTPGGGATFAFELEVAR